MTLLPTFGTKKYGSIKYYLYKVICNINYVAKLLLSSARSKEARLYADTPCGGFTTRLEVTR